MVVIEDMDMLDIKHRCPQQWYESFTEGENIMRSFIILCPTMQQAYHVRDELLDTYPTVWIKSRNKPMSLTSITGTKYRFLSENEADKLWGLCADIIYIDDLESYLTRQGMGNIDDLQLYLSQKVCHNIDDYLSRKVKAKYYKMLINSVYGIPREWSLKIKKVIFNEPATIIFWKNGCKTVVKCQDDEPFDPEKGLAMAIAKYALGNEGNYYNTFTKYLPKEDETNEKSNN